MPEQHVANPKALSEFLLAGVRYAFSVHRGALVSGIATACSAPRWLQGTTRSTWSFGRRRDIHGLSRASC